MKRGRTMNRVMWPALLVVLVAALVQFERRLEQPPVAQAQTISPVFGPTIAEGIWFLPDTLGAGPFAVHTDEGDWWAFATRQSTYNPLGYFLVMWENPNNYVSIASPCALRPWGVLFRWTRYSYLVTDPEDQRFWQPVHAGQFGVSADPLLSGGVVSGWDKTMLFWAGPEVTGDWGTYSGPSAPIGLASLGATIPALTIPGFVPGVDQALEGCDPVFFEDPPAIPVPNGPGTTGNPPTEGVEVNPPPPPSPEPSATPTPTAHPTPAPTPRATAMPTARPTAAPTARPTASPTLRPTPVRTPEPCNWNGTWRHGPRGQPDLVLTLTGTTLTGTFGYYGRVSGSVSVDTFSGNVTSDRGVDNALQFRIGWGTDGGGRLTNFIACFYMAVKLGNEGWTDFQR